MMPLHEVQRHLRNVWKIRWLKVLISVSVIVAAIGLLFVLSRFPKSVDVEKAGFSPVKSQAARHEMVLSRLVPASDGLLFSYQGKPDQTIQFFCERARLSKDTYERYDDPTIHDPLPKSEANVSYTASDIDRSSKGIPEQQKPKAATEMQSCLAYFRVSLLDPKKSPSEIHFYQPFAGSALNRSLKIRAENADLEISLGQGQPNKGRLPPGCGKLLKVNGWTLPIDGRSDLKFEVPAGSSFQIDFLLNTTSSATTNDNFEPFRLENRPLRAQVLAIDEHETKSSCTSALEVAAPKNGEPVRINSLKLAPAEIEIAFSGVALVRSNCELVTTINLLSFITNNLIAAAILTLAIGALVTWFVSSIKNPSMRDK